MGKDRRGFLRLGGGALAGAGLTTLGVNHLSGEDTDSSRSNAGDSVEPSKLDISAQAFPAPRGKSQEAVNIGGTGWLPGENFVDSSEAVEVASINEKFEDFLLAENVFVGINSDEVFATNYLEGEDLRASTENQILSVSLNEGDVGFVTGSAYRNIGLEDQSLNSEYSVDLDDDVELFSLDQADIAVDNDRIVVFTENYKKNIDLSPEGVGSINASTACFGGALSFLDEEGVMYDVAIDDILGSEDSSVQFTELGDIVDGDASDTAISKNEGIFITEKNAIGYISEDRNDTDTIAVYGLEPSRPITNGETIVVPNQEEIHFAELEDGSIEYTGSREFGDIEGVYGLGNNVLVSGNDFTQIVNAQTMEDAVELSENVAYADEFRILEEKENGYVLRQQEMSQPYEIRFQEGDLRVTNELGRDMLTHVSATPKDNSYSFEDVYKMIQEDETLQLDLKSDLKLQKT